jgi:hypothetical protein
MILSHQVTLARHDGVLDTPNKVARHIPARISDVLSWDAETINFERSTKLVQEQL